MAQHRPRGGGKQRTLPPQEGGGVPAGDRHALGFSAAARGKEQVEAVAGTRGGRSRLLFVGVKSGLGKRRRTDSRGGGGNKALSGGKQQAGPGRLKHPFGAGGRNLPVDRQIGAVGDRAGRDTDRHQRLLVAVDSDRDAGRNLPQQQSREPPGSRGQLPKGKNPLRTAVSGRIRFRKAQQAGGHRHGVPSPASCSGGISEGSYITFEWLTRISSRGSSRPLSRSKQRR